MDPFLTFFAVMILVSLIIPKMGPFLSLVVAAILFGLLAGMGQEVMGYMATGLGRIFSSLAIVVFSGALLAEYLRRTGAIERIIGDLRGLAHRSLLVSGAAGYLVSLPVMCSITAYMILEPVVRGLGNAGNGANKRDLFMTSVCSIISFNLIYPSPVMVTLSDNFGVKSFDLLTSSIPISLVLFALAYIIFLQLPGNETRTELIPVPRISRARAWAPMSVSLVLILQGGFWEGAKMLANPRIALLTGALLGLALEKDMIPDLIHAASRRSGVILLDLCGAGAFGSVVAHSHLGEEMYHLGQFLPLLVLPFLISAVLQLAQGSRVVTAVVAAEILADYPLEGVTLALLVAAGAFMFSYISDPYFWLIKNSTGASMKEMALRYTLPLSILGLVTFGLAAVFSII
jgi:gluconate:H+ symporter, GntP family